MSYAQLLIDCLDMIMRIDGRQANSELQVKNAASLTFPQFDKIEIPTSPLHRTAA
jgi:hypothetical protein